MASGHVYILMNAAMPGLLKIGMTEREPEDRAREISQVTGVALPYSVAYSEAVPDCARAESLVHARLDNYRTNASREFFHLPLKDAIAAVRQVAEEVRRSTPTPVAEGMRGSSPQLAGGKGNWQFMAGQWWRW